LEEEFGDITALFVVVDVDVVVDDDVEVSVFTSANPFELFVDIT
jgi:hypothetical protein